MASGFSIPDWLVDQAGANASADPPDPAAAEREAVRRYGRVLSASASASRALADLDGGFAADTDFATAPERYRAALDALGRRHAEAFDRDEVGRSIFRRDFGALAEHAIQRFQSANAGREAAHWAQTLEDRWDSLAGLARDADDAGRAAILRQAALEAHRAQGFGLVPDADTAFRTFLDRIEPVKGIRQPALPGEDSRFLEAREGRGDGLSTGADAQVEEAPVFDSSKQKPKPPKRLSPESAASPACKAETPGVTNHWKPFTDAVRRLPDVSDMESHIYGRIFAAEGGMEKNRKSSAFAGIMADTLGDQKKADRALAGLPAAPKDLSHDQVAAVYRSYLNEALKEAGGVEALDQVGNWDTASAVADVLFREGRTGGARRVGEALSAVITKLDKDGEVARLGLETYRVGQIVGPQTLAAIRTLERAGHGASFRDALIQVRLSGRYGSEKDRIKAFR